MIFILLGNSIHLNIDNLCWYNVCCV